MPIDFGKPFIGKNDHFLFDAIVDVGHVTVPVDNLSQLVQQKAEFSTHNPSLVGEAFRTVPTIVVGPAQKPSWYDRRSTIINARSGESGYY